jgi:hypothetical protein
LFWLKKNFQLTDLLPSSGKRKDIILFLIDGVNPYSLSIDIELLQRMDHTRKHTHARTNRAEFMILPDDGSSSASETNISLAKTIRLKNRNNVPLHKLLKLLWLLK